MTLPLEVAPLVDALLAGIRTALSDNLTGFYLRGSLALGDFNPETSDVDILVVTERPVSDAEFEALSVLHKRINPRDNQFGRHYEVAYIDRASLRRFRPGERNHPTVGTDWPFVRAEHRDNFVIERWIVREHGVALLGPGPKTLIDPISAQELRDAAASELRMRVDDWAGEGVPPPTWLTPRNYQAFEIETICRGLYTCRLGTLPTKPQAVVWALNALPDRWRGVILWSQAHRNDPTPDISALVEMIPFARWAADHVRT